MIPNQKPFYFLRHGETDHNVDKIYDDMTDVPLNKRGKEQALNLNKVLAKLTISTVCSSPLGRVQQTKQIALNGIDYQDFIFDDLKECHGHMWRLFLAWEERSLNHLEWGLIYSFVEQTKKALIDALKLPAPLLVIAHGGTYWVLCHLLQIPGDRKIDNCRLIKIFPLDENCWDSEEIGKEIING